MVTNPANQLKRETRLKAEVLASPAYKERCELLFTLFCDSRELGSSPQEILGIQVGLAEILRHFEDKKREFKQADDDVGATVAKRLILITKQIADSLVWRVLGYDRVAIQLLSEHPQPGHLDETATSDLEIAHRIVEQENALVLINDLTSILRHGDLTIISNGEIAIMETKSGRASKRDRRARRQRRTLNELIRFLNTGFRIAENRRDFIFKSDVSIETHHSSISELISQVKRHGYHRIDASDSLAIEAVWMKDRSAVLPKDRPFGNVEHVARFHNLQPFDKSASRIAPYGIFPLDHRSCFELMTGDIFLLATLNFEGLQSLYDQHGLRLDLPRPDEAEIKAYVDAPMRERKKLIRAGNLVITKDKYSISLTPDLYARIHREFIDERTVLEADRQLIDFVKSMQIPDDKRTRLYTGYVDEHSIWA